MTIGSDYNITALSGAGMIVQYSVDKETWHTALDENKDKWMRFKYGSDSDWSVFKIGGKDGRGIVSQQTFYLSTSSGSVPSVLVYADEDKRYYTDENGDYYLSGNWTDVTQLATEEKPYLWTFTVTFYDDGTIYTTEPALAATWVKGDIGDQGEPGVPFVARQNYSAFSSYARGSVYVHGYFLQDKQWIQADVPGYFTMDSKTYWIWGAAAPLSSVDGYLCVQDSSTSKPAQRISACKPVICFNTVSDKSKWKTLSAGTGKAADMDNPENLIAFARIKTSSVSGSVYVDTIEPARLSDISASDEGAFSLSYEGIAAEYGTVSSFKDYETAEITPYEVLPVSASKNTYTLSPKEKKYAQRGSVMFKIISTVKESPSISDSGDSVYPVVPAASQTDTQIWAFNGSFWEYVDTAKWCYSECALLMGHDLPGIAGLYAGEGLGTPSVCGTYIKTLTANKAFINELVANEAFIRKLGTNELHIDTEGDNTGKIYGGAYDSDGNASGTGGGFYLGADGTVKIKGELVIGGTGQSVSDAISDATSASEFTYTRLYYYSSTGTTPDAPAGFETTSILNTWTSSASAPSKTARTYYSYCYRTGSGTYTYGEVSQNAAEIDSAIATAESNANDYAKAQADAAEKTAKSYADTQATAAQKAAESTFNTWKNGDYAKSLSDLQSQVDGKAETWYQSTDPSSSWTTDEKKKHVGDLWLCTANIESETTKYKKDSTYIYQKGTGGTYSWAEQQVPSEVFDKIDGKAAVYVERPSSYKANDLWILSKDTTLDKTVYSEGEVLVATQDAESFSEKDWKKKFRYTDDTAANKALNARRVVKRTTIYYMKQSRLYDQPNMPDAPASKDGVSDTQLSDEGWSSVYPNTKSFVQTVTCGSVVYESEAIVYSCEMTEISENSKTSYEFSEVVKDFTGEILDAKVHGDTLIEGRYINTGLIDADTLLAQNIAMKKNGVIRSVNYTGKISSDGVITTPAHGMSSDQLYLDLSKYEPRFFLHEIKAGETEDIYLSILPFSCLLYFIKQDGKTPSGLKPVSQEQLTISSPSYTNNGANYYDIDISGIGSDEVTKKIVYADMGSSASSLMIRLKNSGSSTVYIYTYTQGGIDKEIAEKVSGGKGWAIDYKGNADFNGGNFNSITVSGQSTFQGLMKQGLQSYKGVFLSFIYYNNDVKVINSGLKGLKVERMKISGWYRVTINRKEITSDSMLSALNSIAEMNTHFVGVEVITASDYMVSKKFTYTATTEETIETVSCNETTTTTVTKGSTVEESQYIGAHPMCHVNCHAIAPTDLYFADQKKRHNFQSDMSVSETQHEYLMTPYLRKINKVSNNVNSVIKNSDPAEAVGFSNMYVTDNEIQFCLVFTDFNTDKYEDVLGGCSLVLNFYGTNVNIK